MTAALVPVLPVNNETFAERLSHIGVLAAMPWLMWTVNPHLFITAAGNSYLDPWVYTGFFLSLPKFLLRFGGTYYSTRISWLLPGYASHRVFADAPLVANYVLHLSFFYLLIASAYICLSRCIGRRAALLATLLFAWSPIPLTAISWDYVDGAGIAYIVATLACIELAPRSGRGALWATCAGAFAACAAFANVFLLITWPLFILFYVLRANATASRFSLVAGVGACLGIVASAGVLQFFFARVDGQGTFFVPQLLIGWSLLHDPAHPYLSPGFAWLRHVPSLGPAIAAGFVAAAYLMLPSTRQRAPIRAFQLVALTAAGLWVAAQLVGGVAALQYSYYTSYLSAIMILAFVVRATEGIESVRGRTFAGLALVTTLVMAASHRYIYADLVSFWSRADMIRRSWFAFAREQSAPDVTALTAAIAAGIVGIVILAWLRTDAVRFAAFVPVFAIVSAAAPHDFPQRTAPDPREPYLQTVAAHRFLAGYLDKWPLRIWFDGRDASRPFVSITSTFTWGFVLLNDTLPAITPEQAHSLEPGTRLAMLIAGDADGERGLAVLRDSGRSPVVVARRQFGTGSRLFSVTIVDLP